MKSMTLIAGLSLGLLGCASVVPSTALLASRLDPLTADPAALAAFPVLPEGVGILPDESVLILSGVRPDTGEEASETFVLQAWQDGYRIAPEDHARLAAQQDKLAMWKQGPGVNGTLTITTAGCLIGRGPDRDARYSVDVMLSEGGRRLPLLRDVPLEQVGLDPATMPPCPVD